jgi:phospholipid/cholesterol/gamma-HCH transport system substrate-binding protein
MRLSRRSTPEQRVPRKDRRGMSPVKAGAILIVLVVIGTYFGFSKHVPFTHGFRVKAVFQSAVSIRKNSPVRIAGVNVGKVKGISRYKHSELSVVSMELNESALPLHRNSTFKIRPRIFLEGNFFVDVKPGIGRSPKLHDGDTVGVAQTASPVQLDEVLTSLQYDARQDLKDVLDGYGTALTTQPSAAEDADQDPSVRGLSAAQALNKTFDNSAQALRGVAVVNQALLGTESHDLSKLLKSFGTVAAALDTNEAQLQDLITNFNRTTGSFAAEQDNLRSSIRLLAPTLENANRALTDLNAAFPPTRAFAREILPGVRETPATIRAGLPWIDQTRRLLAPSELRGLAQQLQPASADLASLTDSTIALLPQVDLVDKCVTRVVLPTGDVVIQDGGPANASLHTGVENYKEFWYTLVGATSEGQNVDGNGQYIRVQAGGGPYTIATGKSSFGNDTLYGNAVVPPLGTRPKFSGNRPPYNSSFPCYRNQLPDLNGPAADPGPADNVIATHAARLDAQPAQAASGAARRSPTGAGGGQGDSLVDELISRLNPFGGAAPAAAAAPGGRP